MKFNTLTGPAIAAALLLAAAGCSAVPKPPSTGQMTPERREEQVLTSRACELGATGTLTPLLCIHEGAGADLGLAPDTSDFRF